MTAPKSPSYWLKIVRGEAPLIVSIPHTGNQMMEDCWDNIGADWLVRNDTDWNVDELYDFAAALGATIVRTLLCRTMIDVNRDPSGKSLYPGQTTTELCPTTLFNGMPLYKGGRVPGPAEITRRIEAYHKPYHDALAAEISRLRQAHAEVVLWDAHSIASRLPRLFDGELPHLNFGTNNGASCAPHLLAELERIADDSAFTHVANGRFRGGYITRHHGRPRDGVHAIQLELAQRTYMDEHEHPDGLYKKGPPVFLDDRAEPARALLRRLLEACIAFAKSETV